MTSAIPVRPPAAVGAKVTVRLHELPGLTGAVQALVRLKSPEMEEPVICIPLFVVDATLTATVVCDVMPTTTLPRFGLG